MKATATRCDLGRTEKKALETIPGVGPRIAAHLESLGVRQVADLEHASPQRLYDGLCERTGARVDPCVLYTFRCAVYYASHAVHDPEKLKWWNWKLTN